MKDILYITIPIILFLLGVISGLVVTDFFEKYSYSRKSKSSKPKIIPKPQPSFKHELRDLSIEYGLDKPQYFELWDNITKFRHLSLKEQYDLLESLRPYPKIIIYLDKIQRRDLS